MKKKSETCSYLSLIYLADSDETLLTARLPVTVSNVQTWSWACIKKFSQGRTQLLTSRHMLSALESPRWPILIVCGASWPSAWWGNYLLYSKRSIWSEMRRADQYLCHSHLYRNRTWGGRWSLQNREKPVTAVNRDYPGSIPSGAVLRFVFFFFWSDPAVRSHLFQRRKGRSLIWLNGPNRNGFSIETKISSYAFYYLIRGAFRTKIKCMLNF